jgi:hypothetical protein
MDPEHLLVWLEAVPKDVRPPRVGMVCRRHADAMVVPRGWTLDDRREARPRLFRVADAPSGDHPSRGRRPRSKRKAGDETGPIVVEPLQLAFGDQPESAEHGPTDPEITVADIAPTSERDPDETQATPWKFEFDQSDDLGGLLNASSPLLSRAFRSAPRSKGSKPT